MPFLIQSNNCLTAWRDAAGYIINHGDGFNLMVHIENPLNYTEPQLLEITNSGVISRLEVNNVINTIFPAKLHARNIAISNLQFYDLHEAIYIRGKSMHKKNKSKWGTYFLRFTKFGNNKKNQLEKIITDINSRTQQYTACYIMHASSADVDSNTRNIANPCLQYVQFGLVNNLINITAIYRNHDFLNKALSNYIGLAKLLEFVCQKTGRNIGTFTCHSIHYYISNKTKLNNCFNNLTW